MDKQAAEKMVNQFQDLAIWSNAHPSNIPDHVVPRLVELKGQIIEALTHTPVVKDSLTTGPNPDRLLEASKAVLDWYDGALVADGCYYEMQALREAIEAMREAINAKGKAATNG